MSGLLNRFRAQPDLYTGTVVGATPDGLPMIGPYAPYLREEEIEELPREPTYHSRMFRMWEPDDAEQYARIMTEAASQRFRVTQRQPFPVADVADHPGGHLKIWLEWVQYHVEVPAGAPFRGIGGPS